MFQADLIKNEEEIIGSSNFNLVLTYYNREGQKSFNLRAHKSLSLFYSFSISPSLCQSEKSQGWLFTSSTLIGLNAPRCFAPL